MDYVIRLGLLKKEVFKTALEAAKPSFAQAMMLLWKGTKAEDDKSRIRKFVGLYEDRLSTIFGVKSLKEVLKHLATPIHCKVELLELVQSNDLGCSMFGELVQVLLSQEISARMAKSFEEHVLGENLDSQAKYNEMISKIQDDCREADPTNLCRPRRQVKIDYRGFSVLMAELVYTTNFEIHRHRHHHHHHHPFSPRGASQCQVDFDAD